MPGLTDKPADLGPDGPGFPGEGEQPSEPTFDLVEPINQIYEFGKSSFEIDFLVDGAPPAQIERAEPWLSGPVEPGDIGNHAISGGKSETAIAPDCESDVDFVAPPNKTINRAPTAFQEDTLFFREDDLSG